MKTKITRLSDVITFQPNMSLGLTQILPLLDAAVMVDIGCEWHMLGLATELPRFLIYLPDDVFEYVDTMPKGKCIRLLVRTGLKPDRNPATGGSYEKVEVFDTRLARGKISGEILAALKAKCAGTPWYSNLTLCSWKFKR
jgi:hypothetical protein